MIRNPIEKRLAAEALGTAFLLMAVVGSGILAADLAGADGAAALLANSLATGAALIALILTFMNVSGAHFNPAVTLAACLGGGLPWRQLPPYVAAQAVGAVSGTALANLMFDQPAFFLAERVREGNGLLLGEVVATFGLVAIIVGTFHARPNAVAYAVGAYITGAVWFTSSTSFANPAVTLGRTMTDTYTGIRPVDAPAFVAAQLAGAALAACLMPWMVSGRTRRTAQSTSHK